MTDVATKCALRAVNASKKYVGGRVSVSAVDPAGNLQRPQTTWLYLGWGRGRGGKRSDPQAKILATAFWRSSLIAFCEILRTSASKRIYFASAMQRNVPSADKSWSVVTPGLLTHKKLAPLLVVYVDLLNAIDYRIRRTYKNVHVKWWKPGIEFICILFNDFVK